MEKITVLLADDHVLVREGTCKLLEREEDLHVVGEAGDGIVLPAISYQGSDMASIASSSSKTRLKRAIANRYFWSVAFMLAASTFLHYSTLQIRLPYLTLFPLTRHAIERIIFILPVAGAAFAFGQAGGLLTLAIAILNYAPARLPAFPSSGGRPFGDGGRRSCRLSRDLDDRDSGKGEETSPKSR